ncbi:hypothetical protein CLPUN_05080 [Clostridium puniceum]|uniref:Uncharacterized protein n=1 Tax=Clostridium puniceum TaxID=29367 RepID=A0A1S8TX00_9CLOT|nr:hypothetical protein [Clostridium puniceum]OOM82129.1 hypothetical protein CLPUN_05080 [Clostridium puniceum]
MNKKILDLVNLDIDKELENIQEDDKAAKEIIKSYCNNNGNKLDYDMQLDLIEMLVDVNKRKVKLAKLLNELKIGFSYSYLRDEKGYKYIIVRV